MVVLVERIELNSAEPPDTQRKMNLHRDYARTKKQATRFRRGQVLLSHMVNETEINIG